jgi:hypothetical protein
MKTVHEMAFEAGILATYPDFDKRMGRFRDLVLREAEKAVYAVKPVETDMMPHEQFAFETAILLAGDAIRAMKGQK